MIFRSRSSATFSRATNSDETARSRPDAGFDDSVDATDLARQAAPVDFPDLLGAADEFFDAVAEGLVLGRRVAPSVVGNDAARTCKGDRFRAAAIAVGRAATRFAECSRPVPFGEDAGNRPDARPEFDSSVEVAPADFSDLPAAANRLVLGCRMVAGNDAMRTWEGFRVRARARLLVGGAAARLVPL